MNPKKRKHSVAPDEGSLMVLGIRGTGTVGQG